MRCDLLFQERAMGYRWIHRCGFRCGVNSFRRDDEMKIIFAQLEVRKTVGSSFTCVGRRVSSFRFGQAGNKPTHFKAWFIAREAVLPESSAFDVQGVLDSL
jgi:hypothetical protein